jgi:hypothetical protein
VTPGQLRRTKEDRTPSLGQHALCIYGTDGGWGGRYWHFKWETIQDLNHGFQLPFDSAMPFPHLIFLSIILHVNYSLSEVIN